MSKKILNKKEYFQGCQKQLERLGYKNKKSIRWIKFNATKSSVCPIDINSIIKVKFGGNISTHQDYADNWEWNNSVAYPITHYAIVRKAPKKSIVSRTLAADTSAVRVAENSTHTAAHTASAGNTHVEVTPQMDTYPPALPRYCRKHYEVEKGEIILTTIAYIVMAEFIVFIIVAIYNGYRPPGWI